MTLDPSEEQALLRDMVTRFLADHTPPAGPCHGPMSTEDWQALGELGVLALAVPEDRGGLGGGPIEIALVGEALGRAAAMTPMAEGAVLCGSLLAASNNEELRPAWMEGVVSGDHLIGYAGDNALPATENDGFWSLTGECRLVRHGDAAAAFIVQTDDPSLGLVMVKSSAVGLTVNPYRIADGDMAAQLRFDDVRVSAADRLDVSPDDVRHALSLGRLAMVAEMVGLMQTLYENTVDYVRQRRQFGVAIGTFQVVQHRAARLFILSEQARSMMVRALMSEEASFATSVTEAYAYVADAALRLAQDATQLHGGMGVTEELLIGRGHRRILLLSHLFGGAIGARADLSAAA